MPENRPHSMASYAEQFEPVDGELPLAHVLPCKSLLQVLRDGRLTPNVPGSIEIINKDSLPLLESERPGAIQRIGGTELLDELHTGVVHFSVGVPYFRPCFSYRKDIARPYHSAVLIFDEHDIPVDYIYANDSGTFIYNEQYGDDAIPKELTLKGMRLDGMRQARQYIAAMFGDVSDYLMSMTKKVAPDTDNPYPHFIHNMLTNPQNRPTDAKEASVAVEVKTEEAVSLDKLKGMVLPATLMLEKEVQKFLIDHPRVQFRVYTVSPWVGAEECHAAVLNETYKLYRDMGVFKDMTPDSFISQVNAAVERVHAARTEHVTGQGM